MKLRIGTRRSRLAIAQTMLAAEAINRTFPDIETEIVHITTKGDAVTDRPLAEIGGRGVFVTEIQNMLLENRIDIAVHSAKDMPAVLAPGTDIGAVLKREHPFDVLVTRRDTGDITGGSGAGLRIGTGSSRRISGVRKLLPQAEFADIRGNVDTRLEKLMNGSYDAVVLAEAGLQRLALADDERFFYRRLDDCIMLPAPCQGIIAVQCRSGELDELMSAIDHRETHLCFAAERTVLRLLDSGCSAPAGAFAQINENVITLKASRDQLTFSEASAPAENAEELAERVVTML